MFISDCKKFTFGFYFALILNSSQASDIKIDFEENGPVFFHLKLSSREDAYRGARTFPLISNTSSVAINGAGYFYIKLPSREDAYTRTGTFILDQYGTIVTLQGYKLQPELKIPANTVKVEISPDGEVMAKIDGQINLQSIGIIELATFENLDGLQALHDNYYQETQVSGAATLGQAGAIGYGTLQQGWYEGSNVNAITSVTGLIDMQRGL